MSTGVAAPGALEPVLDPRFVAQFLAGMPAQVAARFDARQLFAVQQAFGPRRGRERRRGWHCRLALPCWGGQAYQLTLAPIDETEPLQDRRTAALRVATWRGLALGVALGLVAGGAAIALLAAAVVAGA